MQAPLQRPRALRFGIFEMDLDSEELRKNGIKLKLRGQPFRMLATIVERAGNVVAYEELRAQFWSTVTIEDYKHSLANSMLAIRRVLDDSANNPRYIETVPRGYRFLVPVEFIARPLAHENGSGNSLTDGLLAEMQEIGREFINTSDCRGLALLLYRCEGLRDQYPRDPKLPDLQLLMADIKSAIDRSAAHEPNWTNHPVSFEAASRVFDDPNALSIPDSFGNDGWKTLGMASEFVLLVVEHTGRQESGQQVVRITRARRATLQERRFYEQTRK
jgi:DNA-binding winged helix-turn-helix (wHTH) protein/uncharacterized DUF497 family protein